MCGIVGSVSLGTGRRVDAVTLAAMRDAMVHRGPDGAGLWCAPDGRIGLAHRRLSIIDLSALAAQPMENEDGALRIVFNGEIYNHREVRQALVAGGRHTWRTDHSDTEVLLHAYEEWGMDMLHRLRGMFAFALWDGRTGELWLVRDRMGIKPLYYCVHDGRLSFASEIKALLRDPSVPRGLNEGALFHYLSFVATPAPETLFAGIRKLPNGCLLRVRGDGQIEERRWYDLWDHVVPAPTISFADAKDRLLDELKVAVGLRQVSDVPVGVFLSGGVDSSTNVALFREQVSGPVKTFSIGYDAEYDSYRNELHHAAAVASRFGTEHHERRLTMDDLMAFVPRMVELQDEPIADPVCVPLYYLAEMARREGVIVAQAGEGADELFFGYENWRKKWQLQRSLSGWAGGVAGRGLLAGLTVAGRAGGKEAEAVRRTLDGRPLFWGTTEAFTDLEKRALLHPRLRGEFRDRSSWEAIAPVWERFTAKAWERSWMNWMTYVDLSTRLPELLLMRLDKMTMGASVEGREPFLDHRLAEFVLSIPEAVKLEGGVLKALLKASVRGVIPDAVIDRRKQGFGVPVTEWILGRLGTHIRETLDDFCRRTDVLDRTAVLAMYDRDRDPRLWYLYNVATWYNQFIDARS